MKISRVQAFGFRGLREYDEELPPSKAFLLYGLNGTGKSSLYQAVQFGLTGELPAIEHCTIPLHEVYRHVALQDNQTAWVKLTLLDGTEEYTVRRELHSNGNIDTELSSGEFGERIDDPATKLCFLTRDEFAEMVEEAEEERWNRLSPLLGHRQLGKFRNGIRSVKRQIRKDLELSSLQRERDQIAAEVETLGERRAERLGECEYEEFSRSQLSDDLDELGVSSELPEDLEELDWEVLEDELEEGKQLTAKNRELEWVMKRADASDIDVDKDGDLSTALDFLNRLHQEERLGHQVFHATFFSQAAKVVQGYEDAPCPVCGLYPDDWNERISTLEEKAGKLADDTELKEKTEKNLRKERGRVDAAVSALEKLAESDAVELTEPEKNLQRSLCVYQGQLDSALKRITDEPPTGLSSEQIDNFQETSQGIEELSTQVVQNLRSRRDQLKSTVEDLSESPGRLRLIRLKQLTDTEIEYNDKTDRLELLSTKFNELDSIVEEVQSFAQRVEHAEGELTGSMVDTIGGRVSDIYAAMTGNSDLEPSLKRDESHGVAKAKILVDDFFGFGSVPAREYLSDSYRNALGLSIYFAAMEFRSPALRTFIFDDVTHSTDSHHRRGLAKFLVESLTDEFQVAVLTHDEHWYDRLKDLMKGDAKCRRILQWSPAGIRTKSDSWHSLLDSAEQKIKAGDRGAGNVLRMALEEFLAKACEDYRIEVPFKRSAAQVKLETLRNRLVARLKNIAADGTEIIDPNQPEVHVFKTSQRITNLASHHATSGDVESVDLKDAHEDLKDFMKLFVCQNEVSDGICGWTLDRLDRSDPTTEKQCPQCQQTFGKA